MNILYALVISISDALLIYVSLGYITAGKRFYDKARNISLAAMALALLAFLFSPFAV